MAAFAASAPVRRARTPLRAACVRASAGGGVSAGPRARAGAVTRRAALLAGGAAALGPLAAAVAAGAGTEEVASAQYGYSFVVPAAGWTRNSAELSGMRTLTAFTRDADASGATNVSMVETPVAGDFMKLTSFGPMETVLKMIVPDGQKGVSGDVLAARLDVAKNAYVVEYTLKVGADAPMRHLVTVFSLQPGRFLLTLTAQTTEDLWAQREKELRAVAESYKIRFLD